VKTKVQRSALPDPATLRRLLSEQPGLLADGARVADLDAQGPTGVDIILADEEGRPILVDIVLDEQREVPTRAREHVEWLEQTKRLFLRAYSRDGVVRTEDPVLLFVSSSFPAAVVAAVGCIKDVRVKLVRAEYFEIDGVGELACEEVSVPDSPRLSPAAARRTTEFAGSAASPFESGIESANVRALFALFKSGVDGLDGGIAARDSNGGVVFEIGQKAIARVSASPGSFTVSPGDPVANPIVVSDRVSLERALNAVVSLFVREGMGNGDNGNGRSASGDTEFRNELARIWGGGVGRKERA